MNEKPFSFEISVVAVDTTSVRTTSTYTPPCGSCSDPEAASIDWKVNQAADSPAVEAAALNWYAPPLEGTVIVLVREPALLEAQELLAGCEGCEDHAEIAFDYLLDAVTGCDPSETEYLMCRPARCPQCFSPVTEKTLVISK